MLNTESLRKYKVLRASAKKWMKDNPSKEPRFSSYGTMIFDENEAAEEIGEHMIKEAKNSGFEIVSPGEIVASFFTAKAFMEAERKEQMKTSSQP